MDNLSHSDRRKNMQNIRSTNTLMELSVRSALHKKGLRFRKYSKYLVGKPDIVFSKPKVVVFLDSCFWHKCRYHFIEPKSNRKYWIPKLNRNKERAKEVNKLLRNDGWIVLRFWEHQVKNDLDVVISKIYKEVKKRK
ncbi:MAG: very short patch repair endonuclease [Ignavibacteria bacterium]|jgi:DNA mismatch endonuclease (patch repair protein)